MIACDWRIAALIASLGQHFYVGNFVLLITNSEQLFGCHQRFVSLQRYLGTWSAVVNLEAFESNSFSIRSLFVLLTTGPSAQIFLSQVSLSQTRWLHISDVNGAALEGVAVPPDCEFLLAHVAGGGEVVRVEEVFRLRPWLPLRASPFGVWTSGGPWRWTSLSFHERRSDFAGLQVKAIYVTVPSVITVTVIGDDVEIGGYFGKIWDTTARSLNFTTKYEESNNESWNGVIGKVMSGSVDVGVGDFTMTPQRAEKVDFSLTLIGTKFFVCIQRPSPSQVRWRDFISPFPAKVWLSVLALMLLSTLCLLLTVGFKYDPIQKFLYTLGIFCQQGQAVASRRWSSRLVVWVLYSAATVLQAAYSANRVASLAVLDVSMPFNTLEDLLADGSYKLGLVANSAHFTHFSTATDALLSNVYASLVQPWETSMPMTPLEGLQRVCKEPRYAFMASFDLVPEMVNSLNCNVVFAPEASVKERMGMALPRRSFLRRMINHQLQNQKEAGLLRRLRDLIWPPRPEMPPQDFSPVSPQGVVPLLLWLGLASVFSILLLLLETVHHHTKQEPRYNTCYFLNSNVPENVSHQKNLPGIYDANNRNLPVKDSTVTIPGSTNSPAPNANITNKPVNVSNIPESSYPTLRNTDQTTPVAGSKSTKNTTSTIAPVTNGTAPVTNGTAPVTNGTAPVTNGTAPVTNGTVPVTNGTVPVTNGTAPVTNGTTPAINSTTSMPPTNATTLMPPTNATTLMPTTNATETTTYMPVTNTSVSPSPKSTTPEIKPGSTNVPVFSTNTTPVKDRRFDGPSFIGGIVLSLGTMAIGFVALKFYKARTEINYHTL